MDISVELDAARGNRVAWVTIEATQDSDAEDAAEISLSSYLSAAQIEQFLKGSFLYLVETDPGAAAPSAWAVTINSDLGGEILALSALSTSDTEIHSGDTDLSAFYAMGDDLGVDFGDIGDASDTVVVRLMFVRQ